MSIEKRNSPACSATEYVRIDGTLSIEPRLLRSKEVVADDDDGDEDDEDDEDDDADAVEDEDDEDEDE